MASIQKIIAHAEQHCKEHGTRFTDKRKKIFSALLSSQKATSAYELAELYKAEFGEIIPVMSVYRILDFLQEEKLVHKLSLANKFVACAHITCSHPHEVPQFLICSECQKVEEISIKQSIIDEMQLNADKAGFMLVSPQFEMSCICKSCFKA